MNEILVVIRPAVDPIYSLNEIFGLIHVLYYSRILPKQHALDSSGWKFWHLLSTSKNVTTLIRFVFISIFYIDNFKKSLWNKVLLITLHNQSVFGAVTPQVKLDVILDSI